MTDLPPASTTAQLITLSTKVYQLSVNLISCCPYTIGRARERYWPEERRLIG
jgi:hypothetical protein